MVTVSIAKMFFVKPIYTKVNFEVFILHATEIFAIFFLNSATCKWVRDLSVLWVFFCVIMIKISTNVQNIGQRCGGVQVMFGDPVIGFQVNPPPPSL